MRTIKLVLITIIMIDLSGCQLLPEDAQLKSYRVLVQQGNVINENNVNSLRINMTKEQVVLLLGEPVVNNIFSKDRWDYVYYRKREPETTQLSMVSIFFKKDSVVSMKKIIKNNDGLFEVNTNNKNDLPEFINDEEAIALKKEVFNKIELQGTKESDRKLKNTPEENNKESIKKSEIKKEEESNEELNLSRKNNTNKKEIKEKKEIIIRKEVEKRKNDDEIVKEIIINWAKSWQDKKLEEYFSFYSVDFTSSYFENNELWKKDREKRILGKGKIEIKVENLSTEFIIDKEEKAIVQFQQKYISKKYSDVVIKKITLKKNKNKWVIVSEDLIDGKY